MKSFDSWFQISVASGASFYDNGRTATLRRDRRMEMHDGADIVLFSVDDLLVIRLAEQGKCHSVGAERRLDHVRDVTLVRLQVENQ